MLRRNLVIVRHGESTWNNENKFTGWTDVDLSDRGVQEARRAGELLRQDGIVFDVVYTSLLLRAIRTSWLMLAEMQLAWVDEIKDWRLNERHYGALEGSNKTDLARQIGEDRLHELRRGYRSRPEQVGLDDPRHPGRNPRYIGKISRTDPFGESLEDVVARFTPLWTQIILPKIKNGKRVLVVAHGNSLRALVKILENVSDSQITMMNLPTGMPKIYDIDRSGKVLDANFRATPDEVERRIKAVLDQGKA